MVKLEEKLETENEKQRKRAAYPWYLLFFICVMMSGILQFGIIPSIEFSVVKNKEPSVLNDQLKKMISETKYED